MAEPDQNQRQGEGLVPRLIKELKARSKRSGKKLRLKKVPRPKSIKSIQRGYFRELSAMVDAMKKAIDDIVIARLPNIIAKAISEAPRIDERNDAYSDDIDEAVEKAKVTFFAEYTEAKIAAIALSQANKVDIHNLVNFKKMFKTVLGLDYRNFEPFLESKIKAFTKANVLIMLS